MNGLRDSRAIAGVSAKQAARELGISRQSLATREEHPERMTLAEAAVWLDLLRRQADGGCDAERRHDGRNRKPRDRRESGRVALRVFETWLSYEIGD